MITKIPNPVIAFLGAFIVGVASIPVAAMVNSALGLAMMMLPLWMIYRAS